jgi:hypothetical protein
MDHKPLWGRVYIKLESPEELFRLARAAGWTLIFLYPKRRTLFMTDRAGYFYYVRLSDDSPWMSARFAVVNEFKGEVRPSDEPSTEADEVSIAIIRLARVSPAKRRRENRRLSVRRPIRIKDDRKSPS